MPGANPGMTIWVLPVAPVGNHPARHQPAPDEQLHQRADGRGDEAGALIRTVMADGLADEGREKRAGNAEHGGQDESAGIVRARRKQPRDNPRYETDDDDPENAAHVCRPFLKKQSFKKLALCRMLRTATRYRTNSNP